MKKCPNCGHHFVMPEPNTTKTKASFYEAEFSKYLESQQGLENWITEYVAEQSKC